MAGSILWKCFSFPLVVFLVSAAFGLLLPREQQQLHNSNRVRFQPSRTFFRHSSPYGQQPLQQTIGWQNQVALKNIFSVPRRIHTVEDNTLYRGKRAPPSPRDLQPG